MRQERAVLVVEDDSDVLDFLALLLLDAGYRVRTAVDGREALDVISGWRPDLILLDLMMPKMDGWAFLNRRQVDPGLSDIPVVLMSASTAIDSHPPPADALLPKPFTIDHLLMHVESLTA